MSDEMCVAPSVASAVNWHVVQQEMSESQRALVAKLVKVSREIGFIEFDKKNSGQNYSYASAAQIIRKLNLALAEEGILCHCVSEVPSITVVGEKVYCVITATYEFTDGVATIFGVGTGSGVDKGDKFAMKASTAAYKYAIAHALTLGWDAADPEADEATDKPAKKGAGKKAAKAPAAETSEHAAKLLETIKNAVSLDALADVPKLAKALQANDGPGYEKVRAAYVARKAELSKKEEG